MTYGDHGEWMYPHLDNLSEENKNLRDRLAEVNHLSEAIREDRAIILPHTFFKYTPSGMIDVTIKTVDQLEEMLEWYSTRDKAVSASNDQS